jgi:hypothetical protein
MGQLGTTTHVTCWYSVVQLTLCALSVFVFSKCSLSAMHTALPCFASVKNEAGSSTSGAMHTPYAFALFAFSSHALTADAQSVCTLCNPTCPAPPSRSCWGLERGQPLFAHVSLHSHSLCCLLFLLNCTLLSSCSISVLLNVRHLRLSAAMLHAASAVVSCNNLSLSLCVGRG